MCYRMVPVLWLETKAGYTYAMLSPAPEMERLWGVVVHTWAKTGNGDDPTFYDYDFKLGKPEWWKAKRCFDYAVRYLLYGPGAKEYEDTDESDGETGKAEDSSKGRGKGKGNGKGKGKASAKGETRAMAKVKATATTGPSRREPIPRKVGQPRRTTDGSTRREIRSNKRKQPLSPAASTDHSTDRRSSSADDTSRPMEGERAADGPPAKRGRISEQQVGAGVRTRSRRTPLPKAADVSSPEPSSVRPIPASPRRERQPVQIVFDHDGELVPSRPSASIPVPTPAAPSEPAVPVSAISPFAQVFPHRHLTSPQSVAAPTSNVIIEEEGPVGQAAPDAASGTS